MQERNRSTFHKTLAHVTGLLAVPYGYTVTLWTGSAEASAHFGSPSRREIVAFAVGAISAFLLLAFWGRPAPGHRVPEPVSSMIVVNVLPLVSPAVSPIGVLVPWPPGGFWLSSFAVTLSYGLSLAIFLEIAARPGA